MNLPLQVGQCTIPIWGDVSRLTHQSRRWLLLDMRQSNMWRGFTGITTAKDVAPPPVSLAVKRQCGSVVPLAALEAPAWQDPLVLEFQYRCGCVKVRVVMHQREVVIRGERRG
jgi:hypothetical protein